MGTDTIFFTFFFTWVSEERYYATGSVLSSRTGAITMKYGCFHTRKCKLQKKKKKCVKINTEKLAFV